MSNALVIVKMQLMLMPTTLYETYLSINESHFNIMFSISIGTMYPINSVSKSETPVYTTSLCNFRLTLKTLIISLSGTAHSRRMKEV